MEKMSIQVKAISVNLKKTSKTSSMVNMFNACQHIALRKLIDVIDGRTTGLITIAGYIGVYGIFSSFK